MTEHELENLRAYKRARLKLAFLMYKFAKENHLIKIVKTKN